MFPCSNLCQRVAKVFPCSNLCQRVAKVYPCSNLCQSTAVFLSVDSEVVKLCIG